MLKTRHRSGKYNYCEYLDGNLNSFGNYAKILIDSRTLVIVVTRTIIMIIIMKCIKDIKDTNKDGDKGNGNLIPLMLLHS